MEAFDVVVMLALGAWLLVKSHKIRNLEGRLSEQEDRARDHDRRLDLHFAAIVELKQEGK